MGIWELLFEAAESESLPNHKRMQVGQTRDGKRIVFIDDVGRWIAVISMSDIEQSGGPAGLATVKKMLPFIGR